MRAAVLTLVVAGGWGVACGGETFEANQAPDSGNGAATAAGAAAGSGARNAGNGGTAGSTGGGSTGGASTGGSAGAGGDGGATTGGKAGSGGTGGSATGGSSGSGGTGGSATGGSSGSGGTGGSATGGSSGSGGTGGSATGGSSGSGGTGGSATGGSSGSGGTTVDAGDPCAVLECEWDCCDGKCVNLLNDINNCGECGTECTAGQPHCGSGTCTQPPCVGGIICAANSFCCGAGCCELGKLCCNIPGPVATLSECVDPTPEGTCPQGCKLCACNSPDTPIATPAGNRRIADLRKGDLVYSLHRGEVVIVPIAETNREWVEDHEVTQVVLATGVELEISAGHPTGDGRTFGDLRAGDALDGIEVMAVQTVPYEHSFTYDILPQSDSGMYYAGGVLIGSTIGGSSGVGAISREATHPVTR